MVNFAIWVKLENTARFKSQSVSKTERRAGLTILEPILWQPLTIFDTPGIEDRDGLRPLIKKLRMLQEEERVDDIDAVCHVVKATQNRLTDHHRNISDAFLSLLDSNLYHMLINP
jgi:hypothetical protein